jgi:hypothetical protein
MTLSKLHQGKTKFKKLVLDILDETECLKFLIKSKKQRNTPNTAFSGYLMIWVCIWPD